MRNVVKGPLEIHLTIHCGIDKEGRVTFDWEAEAEVPKGMEPPRIGQYDAKQIMEAAAAAMEIKQHLNWSIAESPPKSEGKPADSVDQLP